MVRVAMIMEKNISLHVLRFLWDQSFYSFLLCRVLISFFWCTLCARSDLFESRARHKKCQVKHLLHATWTFWEEEEEQEERDPKKRKDPTRLKYMDCELWCQPNERVGFIQNMRQRENVCSSPRASPGAWNARGLLGARVESILGILWCDQALSCRTPRLPTFIRTYYIVEHYWAIWLPRACI